MGSVGTMEIMIVLVAALLILGPKKLPDAARQVGKALSEFRKMANGFQTDIKDAFSEDSEPPRYHSPVEPTALKAPPADQADDPVAESPDPPPGTPPGPPASGLPSFPADAELPAPPEDPSRN